MRLVILLSPVGQRNGTVSWTLAAPSLLVEQKLAAHVAGHHRVEVLASVSARAPAHTAHILVILYFNDIVIE